MNVTTDGMWDELDFGTFQKVEIEKNLEDSYGDWVKFRASIIAKPIPGDLVKGDVIKTDTEYIFLTSDFWGVQAATRLINISDNTVANSVRMLVT